MNNIKITLLLIFLFLSISSAQKKNFTTEDVMINSMTYLKPATLEGLQWVNSDEAAYSYVERDGDEYNLVKGFASSGKKEELVSLQFLNTTLMSLEMEGTSGFPEIKWIDGNSFYFWIEHNIVKYDLNSQTPAIMHRLPADIDTTNCKLSPNLTYAAYVQENDLYLSSKQETGKRITYDGSYNVTNGLPASRNEFGIETGIFWAPNSEMIAFYHEDLSDVTDYPLLNIETKPATIEYIKYPMAGGKSQRVKIGVYDITTDRAIWLKTDGEEYQYLTSVTWGPNSEYIYAAHLNRDQNHLQLKKYDALTGELLNTLFEEKNDRYVEPEHPLYFIPNHPDRFLWFSERDGWNHLYEYNTGGKLIKQITYGEWVVTKLNGFDAAGENLFITATKESPIERHFYKVNLSNNELTKYTSGDGTHTVQLHKTGFYFIDEYNSLKVPNETRIIDYKGNIVSVIQKAGNPWEEYSVGDTELFTIKSESNDDLYSRMIYPPDFTKDNNYPVIIYVYGGPHVQKVTHEFIVDKYQIWFRLMAQKGYLIFTLDNHGSPYRGLEFEQTTFRQLGEVELRDQLTGLKHLKSLPYIDTNRIGVYGWSYGGFMATNLMLRSNDQIKVGVAGGPVIDWQYYEVMYTERYMDTPQANPEGYKNSNLLNYIENLNGKLLMMHGTSDPTVVWQNSLLFADKAVELNIPLDYFPYYGHGHHVLKREGIHLYDKITNYFLENL